MDLAFLSPLLVDPSGSKLKATLEDIPVPSVPSMAEIVEASGIALLR